MAFNPDLKVVTGTVRISYPHLDEPWGMEGQEPKYGVDILLPKSDTATKAAIDKAVQAALDEKFQGQLPKGANPIFKDGDKQTERKYDGGVDLENHPEYEGHWVFSARNRKKVAVVDRQANLLEPEEVYGGCYAKVSLIAFGYDVQGNKGISFNLRGVQKVAEGEPFGAVAGSDFDALEPEDGNDLI